VYWRGFNKLFVLSNSNNVVADISLTTFCNCSFKQPSILFWITAGHLTKQNGGRKLDKNIKVRRAYKQTYNKGQSVSLYECTILSLTKTLESLVTIM
jgi:hypothetical protein